MLLVRTFDSGADLQRGTLSPAYSLYLTILGLYILAIILPSLAVGARRLHDTGRSGWWMLLALIPLIGALVLIIFFIMDGEAKYNDYGDDPKGRGESRKDQPVVLSESDITHSSESRASIKDLKCPHCGDGDFKIVGAEGAAGRTFISLLTGPFIYKWLWKDTIAAPWPIRYKCKKCGHKFTGEPAKAPNEETLSVPCIIQFERVSGALGFAMPQVVHLNGMKVAPIKNGQTMTFPTHVRHNVIFVTDHFGTAFANPYAFEAKPGESVRVRFNRKFLES